MNIKQTLAGLVFGASVLYASGCAFDPVETAECMVDKGVMLYSLPLCPNCKEQIKTLEDESPEAWDIFLPNYVDCIIEPSKCDKAGIKRVPAWDFQDDNGAVNAKKIYNWQELADFTGC